MVSTHANSWRLTDLNLITQTPTNSKCFCWRVYEQAHMLYHCLLIFQFSQATEMELLWAPFLFWHFFQHGGHHFRSASWLLIPWYQQHCRLSRGKNRTSDYPQNVSQNAKYFQECKPSVAYFPLCECNVCMCMHVGRGVGVHIYLIDEWFVVACA